MIDILHISCSIPIDDYGSFGVFHRHYHNLPTDQFRVRPVSNHSFFSSMPADEFPDRIALPTRKAWWPPVQPFGLIKPVFYRARFRLLARELDRHIDRSRPHVVVTHLWDFYSFFAAYYAQSRALPLVTFLHDNLYDWLNGEDEKSNARHWVRQALDYSSRVFSISPELIAELSGPHSVKCEVLPPMPQPTAPARRKPLNSGPGIVHAFAGKRFPGIDDLLSDLATQIEARGDKLVLIGESNELTLKLNAKHPATVSSTPKFAKSEEAMRYLAGIADRLIVAYPLIQATERSAWSSLRSSFPSRLVEYAQLNLPVLIFCDKQQALAKWCARKQYPWIATEFSPASIKSMLEGLDAEEATKAAIGFWHKLAIDEFSPDVIQSRFMHALKEAAATNRHA